MPVAAAIAAHYGLRHHVRRVSRAEFDEDIPRILHAMDQPSVDGVNTWFASKAAAEQGFKVVLSGVGGDELFRGYSLFTEIPRAVALGRAISAVPGARTLLSLPCAYLARLRSQPEARRGSFHMSSVAGCISSAGACSSRRIAGADGIRSGPCRPGSPRVAANSARRGPTRSTMSRRSGSRVDTLPTEPTAPGQRLGQHGALTGTADAAGRRHAAPVLAPYMSGFADGAGKAMIARSPRKPLPDDVAKRPKTGFSIPMAQWLSAAAQGVKAAALPAASPERLVTTLGDDRPRPDAWMRVIHVVPAISEEASGPSYSVVRLCTR